MSWVGIIIGALALLFIGFVAMSLFIIGPRGETEEPHANSDSEAGKPESAEQHARKREPR